MGTPETSREPCPDRILDDFGGAFAMGITGGSIYHFMKGTMNSPIGEKFRGGFQTMTMNAPRTGGSFAAWGGLFSAFDCGLVYLRQKEDPWNAILSGAATGGILQIRHGVRAAGRSAAIGGVLLGMIEGCGIMFNRLNSSMGQQVVYYNDPRVVHGETSYGKTGQQEVTEGGTGLFGGLFRGNEGKKDERNGGSETKILESFDTPTTMPSFDYK